MRVSKCQQTGSALPRRNRKTPKNHHSQYCTTKNRPFWAKIEAVDSHTLALKYSIDRIKNFGGCCWMHPGARNVKFSRCNHVITISYLRLLAFMKLEEKINKIFIRKS